MNLRQGPKGNVVIDTGDKTAPEIPPTSQPSTGIVLPSYVSTPVLIGGTILLAYFIFYKN